MNNKTCKHCKYFNDIIRYCNMYDDFTGGNYICPSFQKIETKKFTVSIKETRNIIFRYEKLLKKREELRKSVNWKRYKSIIVCCFKKLGLSSS